MVTGTGGIEHDLPLVSVHMITFNHEKFISQAIEGILCQRTDFRLELVIGEDCSSDDTRGICESYAARYPDVLRLLPSERNLGMMPNANRTTEACRGKYIAICEGDDFWTDPLKLQKQVGFLEDNPEYGLVYSDIRTVDSSDADLEQPLFNILRSRYDKGFIFTALLQGNFINTCSVVYRKELIPLGYDKEKSWFIYDYWLWLRIAAKSKIHFMNEVTAAYRIHENNVSRSPGFKNKRKFYYLFCDVIEAFDKENARGLTIDEEAVIFRKLLSLLWQPYGEIFQKLRIIRMLPCYFPGINRFYKMLLSKFE